MALKPWSDREESPFVKELRAAFDLGYMPEHKRKRQSSNAGNDRQ